MNTPPSSDRALSEGLIVRIALIGEGLLIVLSLGWIVLRGLELRPTLSLATLAQAIAFTTPLALLNLYLFLGPHGPRLRHPAWRVFSEEFIEPLCAALTPRGALLVSLLAGLGEELAFRGVLLSELRPWCGDGGAVVISGVIFGWVHFLGVARRFVPVVLGYCLFGVLLGWIFVATNDIVLMILIHTFYDLWVILAIRRWSKMKREEN